MGRFAPESLFRVVFVSTAIAWISACSMHVIGPANSTPQPASKGSSHLAVADSQNFRVLVYDAPFVTGESASLVLGQPDFTHRNSSSQPSASEFEFPVDVAVDDGGNLWVADSMGDRIVEFKPPLTSGMNASLVMGSNHPSSIAFDSAGNLWVAGGTTVSEFTPPFASDRQPTLTIGAYTTCDPGPYHLYIPPSASATTLCAPSGIAFDSRGDLWVSDFYDLRVLEFVPPFSNGMAASLELGQPLATAFTSNSPQALSASSMCGPEGVAFDSAGNLWLADQECSRVLEFSPPFSNGMAAKLVLGQSGFTQGQLYKFPPAGANTQGHPAALWFDGNGNLMVADSSNGRVLTYTPPFSNGMSASSVLGVPNMTTAGNNCLRTLSETSADALCFPAGGATF